MKDSIGGELRTWPGEEKDRQDRGQAEEGRASREDVPTMFWHDGLDDLANDSNEQTSKISQAPLSMLMWVYCY